MVRTIAGLTAAAALAAAPAAPAAQVTVRDGVAVYTAAAGEVNRLTVDLDSSGATLRDIVPVAGCTPVPGGAHCPGARGVEAHLGDGNDRYDGGAGPAVEKGTPDLAIRVFGDDGDDELVGGAASEVLDGRDGDDRVDGGDAGDLVRGWDGDDLVAGGDGDDVVADGAGADRIDPGPGDDEILAFEDREPERLACGGGRDVVYPGVTDLPELDCERVKLCFCPKGAMPPRALAVIGGVATFRVACPTVADGPQSCRGRLTVSQPLAVPPGAVPPRAFVARSRRYVIPDGRSRLVRVRLPDDVRRAAIRGPLAMRLRIGLDKRSCELRGEYLVTVHAGE